MIDIGYFVIREKQCSQFLEVKDRFGNADYSIGGKVQMVEGVEVGLGQEAEIANFIMLSLDQLKMGEKRQGLRQFKELVFIEVQLF